MSRLARLAVASLLIVAISATLNAAESQQRGDRARVHGTVSGAGPDGQPFRVPGVSVRLVSPVNPDGSVEQVSNDVGEFEFVDIAPGDYQLEAQLEGFGTYTAALAAQAGATVTRDVRLELAGVTETVVVTASGDDGLQARQSAPPTEVLRETMQQVPIASETFQGAMPLVPGVVRGPDGLLNVKGASESQSGLKVNSASVEDPVTGEFAFRLPVEAVRSVQVVTSAYAPEHGQTSGGVTKIETTAGTAQWKVQLQNLEPRPRRRDGAIKGIESWTPRAAVGGPLVGTAVTLFQSVEYQFIRSRVEGLPSSEGDTRLEALSTFTQVDWALDPATRVSATVALFPQSRDFLGLNSFNPQRVTPNLEQQGYLSAVMGRRVLTSNSVLESHAGFMGLNTDVAPSTPGADMVLAPVQNRGSYFNSQTRDSRRYEVLTVYSATPAALGGAHLVKTGAGLSRSVADGLTDHRPVRIVRADGSHAQQIDFLGPATLDSQKTGVLAFAQDTWSLSGRATLEFGVRYDHDTVASTHHLAPRLGISLVPTPDRRTVVRGGIGVFFDKVTLNAASFEQQPTRVITRYQVDGTTPIGAPVVETPGVDGGRLRNPRTVAWNVDLDRELTAQVIVRVGYQERRGSKVAVLDLRDSLAGRDLLLTSGGRSRYREFAVTGRYHRGGDQLAVSYVRSASTGHLNDLNGYFGNVENPVIRADEYSRLAADTPNRIVAWGEFGLPRGFGVAPLVEVRDGFPLSLVDENLDFVGHRNLAGRFPRFFAADLQVWKDLTLPWPRRLKARVGVKVFNLTNHFNPRDFDGNLASARFGGLSNGASRVFRGKFVIGF